VDVGEHLDARPSRRALSVWVAAAFVAVAAAFGAVNLMLVASLRPQVERADEIASGHLEAVAVLSRMHGFVGEMQDAVLLSEGLGADSAELRAVREHLALSLAALGEAARQYHPLVRVPSAAETWESIRTEGLPRLAPLSEEVLQVLATHRADRRPVAEFVAHVRSVHASIQRLVDLHAGLARRDAARIHASLRRFSLGSLILGGMGALAALALLLIALAALGRYAEAAEARAADLEAFASRVAHDLRNPLQTILLGVGTVGRALQDPRLRGFCVRAERSARRLDRMIEDLLLFSRGADPAWERRASVAEVMEGVGEEMQARAAESGVSFSARSEPGLVAAVPPGALRSVLSNLLENAFKFLDPGKAGRVEALGERAPDGGVIVTVRDTGRGIAPEAIPHLFEVGYRSGPPSSGFGIGLATVKRLTGAYGGTVEIRSVAGEGTTVTVRLPAASRPS
jgi:signal transduction histidine kinase